MPARPPPKAKGLQKPDRQAIRSRSRGALLGLALGDALGTTNEFRTLPAPSFPLLAIAPMGRMLGGGPFSVQPGQVTDDTQMACCIAQVLREEGRYDLSLVARQYLAWLPVAFDVGGQIRKVLEAIQSGTPKEIAAEKVWLESGKQAAGNGSLMRTAPIGVFFSKDQKARIAASLQDSALTHIDPRCQLACVALNAAIAAAIQSVGPPTAQAMQQAALKELSIAAADLGRSLSAHVQQVKDALEWIREDLQLAQEDDPRLYGPELHLHRNMGFVRVSLRLAFWELFHVSSVEEALTDVANRGGDSDTNAAIAGCLLGAAHGEEAFPDDWRKIVLGALSRDRGPMGTRYHPRQLLLLSPDEEASISGDE